MTERKEELANAITHGIGSLLFLTTIPYLIRLAQANDRLLWPVVVYGICLSLMYINSTIYHAVAIPHLKKKMRIFDHISIFLLIGGTFTPIIAYNMGSWNGLPFLAGFWGIMACGILFKIFFTGKYKLASTLIYIGVAWIGAMLAWPVVHNMIRPVLLSVIAGGVFYTAGTFFYMKKQLAFNHAIWHLFVLAGSLSHFYAVIISLG